MLFEEYNTQICRFGGQLTSNRRMKSSWKGRKWGSRKPTASWGHWLRRYLMPMARGKLTTAVGKHSLPHCWARTLSDQILVIAMAKALTAMPPRPTKYNGECCPSKASGCVTRLPKVKILTVFKSQRHFQIQAMPPVRILQLCSTRPLRRIRWMPLELQVVLFMVQSLKMPPLTSTFPL